MVIFYDYFLIIIIIMKLFFYKNFLKGEFFLILEKGLLKIIIEEKNLFFFDFDLLKK